MKKNLFAVLLLLGHSPAFAEKKLDISPFLSRLSACSAITHKGDILAGGCYQPITWKWGSSNVGLVWDSNESGDSARSSRGLAGGIFALGVRADKAWSWAWNKMDVEKRGVKVHFIVPKVQVGPMGGFHNKLGWVAGGFLNASWPF